MPLQIPVTQTGLEASIQQAMKNAGRNAQINLGTNSRQINALAQPLGRITGQADEFTKSMEAANARVFAFGASVGIINGVTKAFSSLVKNTIEVEKSLVEINTVLNTSGDSLQKFGNKLFDVAKTTGQTFDVVAKGALELARQGLSTEETLKRINDALILSRLSGLDAQQSVEGLTAAFNSFKETGITTSEILNKLVVVSQKYSVSERDLIEGLKRSASVADQAGVSFDELVGIITTVQERTARGGAVIGNAFKTIFARIQDTGALQDLSNLGIQVTDLEGKVLPATRILQNLGAEFNNLSQLEQADIAKKLGGVYQLSNLLAAVKDLSSEQSKYNDIVKLSAGATNEAYQKNAALNETLASLINKVSVSAQQLGATLGKIGITDSLKGLLSFFNNILEGIQKILGEESALGTFVQGLAKGIGNVLAGPGLALFGAIIAKLSKDLISFGIESLKSFFKIGQSAKEIASVEKAIATALGSNLTLQRQLFALEGNRAAQLKLMTDAIVQQEAVMRRMSATAGSLAGSLYQQGVRSTGGQGLRVPQAAGGYMPAVSQESRDINRGVGGAKSGDKPVVIPNFAFGGGKKGTMVAHTGEYIVPNFARGGSAIFNRDMVRSMGLPAGAQKIGAAGGFIPNFAKAVGPSELIQSVGATSIKDLEKYRILGTKSFDINGNILPESQAKQKLASLGSVYNANLDPKTIMLIPSVSKYNSSGLRTIFKGSRKYGDKLYNSFEGGYSGLDPELKAGGLKSNSKFIKLSGIDSAMNNALASAANNILKSVQPDIKTQPATLTAESIGKYLEAGGAGALGSIRGALFESVINLITKGAKDKNQGTLDVSFDAGNNRTALEEIFGVEGQNVKYADFKNSIGQKDKFIDQVMKNFPRASGGFIPNFAKYIYDSDRIAPDKGATLKAVLASQVKKNLIIGPAGSGKSTLAGKMGKFLSGVGDVANASEIDILSGAARAKGGGISKNLEAIISAVNNSGGKVSYLYAKNLDILSRRAGRTVAEEGDLRSKKQLKGTTYAPLNQFDFMGYVKSKSRNFNLVNGAKGFIPNFADPLKEAIDREMSAGVPASQIYVDQNSSLKNSMNPMGLMVANRRDEPTGGMQGINRARKEGANPMLYGAAGGFVPNYAATSGGDTDLEKPKRDFLGTIFAVQTGLSLLTGATADATSGMGKFANNLTNTLSNIATAALALQGLKSLAPETGKLAGALGKLGPYAMGAVVAFEGFKLSAQLYRDWTGKTEQAAKATAKFNDAVQAAGISLDNLSQSESLKKTKSAEGALYNLGAGFGLSGREYKDPELQKMYAQTALITGMSEKEIAEKAEQAGALNITGYQKLASGGTRAVGEDFNIDKFKEVLADLAVMPEKMVDGKINPEYEKRIKLLQELKEKQDELNEDISEPQKIAEAAKASSKQLEQTIRNIQVESSLRKKLFQQTNKANDAQIAADSDIANIKSDITLSELQRNKLIGRRQFQLEKDLALLENQKSEMTEIANLAKDISEKSMEVGATNKVGAALQTENAIKALSGQDINATTDVAKMLGDMKIDFGLINYETVLKNVLEAALKIKDAAAKTTEEFNQQNNFKERGLSLAEAEAKVNENNSRVFERMQNSLSAMADDRSILARRLGYQSQMVDAEKDLKLAQFEKSSLGMSSSEKIAGQRAIERETFNKQLEINTRKSIVEAEADFIRNSKIQDNIQALQDNNTALKENTNALLKIVPTAGEPQGLNRASFITGGNLQTGAQIAPIVPKGSNIPTVNIPYDGRNAANRYNNPGGAYPRKDLLQFGLEGQGIIGGGHPIGKYPSVTHGAAANMAHFSYLNPVGKTVGQARNQWVTGKSSGFMPLGGMDSNRVISPNDLNNPSFMKQWMRATAQAEGFQGGLSEADLDAAYNFYQSNKAPNVNLGGGFSAAPSNVKMVSPEDQMKKGRELASLATSDEILQKARQYTKELGLQETAAESVAVQIKDFALRIKEVGGEKALQEMLQKSKENAEGISDAIQSIAELEKGGLETQLKDLKESPITFKEGMENGFLSMQVRQAQFAYNLGKEIPEMFSQNMSDAIMSAVTGAESLEDALLNAANSFLTEINKRLMSNLVDQATSSLGNFGMSLFQNKASGGMITGGSGTKDDVPAMLMGGEYVVKKKAVQKYGQEFLSAINNGTLGGYAKGGSVEKDYFTPGYRGGESIVGKEDLLGFATQSYTSGASDVIKGGKNFASIDLEAESLRLTNYGRSRTDGLLGAEKGVKSQAFDLYSSQYQQEQDRLEQIEAIEKAAEEEKKAMWKSFWTGMATAAVTSVASGVAKSAASGYKAAGNKLSGIWSGGTITGADGSAVNAGGLKNYFSSAGQFLTGDFKGASSTYKLSQIGSGEALAEAFKQSSGSENKEFAKYLSSNYSYKPSGSVNNVTSNIPEVSQKTSWFDNFFKRATGGSIPQTSGIDTVPTMLSGGEFIMNRAASQNIGAGNLQSLNAGAGSLPTEEKTEELNDRIISKLDELIDKITSGSLASITINVDSAGNSTKESDTSTSANEALTKFAQQIKEQVVKVIQQEQRVGGLLY
jgi:TP901 family phage tail tape measure protein